MLYPLKFQKVFKEKVWGGRAFEKQLNMNLPSKENYGESWEVSSHTNGMSIVENGILKGKSLKDLIIEYKEILLGKEIYLKYKENFPILIKYLDINDKLSIQVHPDDNYALEKEGEFGKSESWYIIEASSDAKLIMGLKEDITKEKFLEKIKNNDFENLFEIINIKKGDFINIEPGTVHASLEGSVLICEIQQNSDTTYRIYDFDRIVDGKKRDLHLEKALEVINYNYKYEKANILEKIKTENYEKEILVKGKYFNIEKIYVFKKYTEIYKNFVILSIIDGNAKLNGENIKKGETYIIPANLEFKLEGNVELIKTYL